MSPSPAQAPCFFDQFFDQYGLWLMGGELTLLTLLTFAAIATDDYWTREADGEPPSTADDQTV